MVNGGPMEEGVRRRNAPRHELQGLDIIC